MAATAASSAHYRAAAQNHHRVFSSQKQRCISVSFPTQRRRKLVVVRNSKETTATEQESVDAAAKGRDEHPSLISALNVEKALRGLAITDVDHYGRLGLQTAAGSSFDQVNNAYKSKVTEAMNKGLDEEMLNKELELLKESYSILSSVEERRMYDWSLARSGKPDRFVWPYEVDNTPLPTVDPPPQEPEDEGPTTLTGYFFLTWLILSFVLLIAFNR